MPTPMSSPLDLVVVGLGYVGLPLAREATRRRLRVAGLDVSEEVVAELNAGRSRVDDVSEVDMAEMLSAGFLATVDPSVVADADTTVICVPTPLRIDGTPDLNAIISASNVVRDYLHPGMLVVLESTTYPGTTEEVVLPILEEAGLVVGREYHLAFSPERIDPGNRVWGLRNTPKVVGGHTPECTTVAVRFYEQFVDTVVATKGTREAEMAKLLENTYRHVNIALMNEMLIFSRELGVDLWASIAAAKTKPFGFQAFYPGAGVGGHCIPIDPNYLSFKVRTLGYQFRFVELAEDVNARMPGYVATRAMLLLNEHGKAVRGARIVIIGVTFKPNIADEREAPSRPLARQLLGMGADVAYADPYVERWVVDGSEVERIGDLRDGVATADLAIIVQPHDALDLELVVGAAPRVLDTSGRLSGQNVQRL